MEQQNYMVRVSCMTYNQTPYITDALNGFCMQETTFPFVCTIIDDASTDGEPEVIKKYLQEHFDLEDKAIVRNEETDDYILTFARHKTNINCFFAVLYLKYNHYTIKKTKMPYVAEWRDNCKYIALCEGDDYWVHPKKLQIQVDFLELHSEYSGVFGNRIVSIEKNVNSHTNKDVKKYKYRKNEFNIKDVLSGYYVGIQNLCCRAEIIRFPLKTQTNGDIVLSYKCALYGSIKYLDEDFAVYRITGKGVASSRFEEEEIIATYAHWYTFHKELHFKFNKYLVKNQIYYLMPHVFKNGKWGTHYKALKKYHSPNKSRFLWYIIYFIDGGCIWVRNRISDIISNHRGKYRKNNKIIS